MAQLLARLTHGRSGCDRRSSASSPRRFDARARQLRGLAAPPPLSLYVHFPWCVKKCPYCDFNSHAPREGGIPEQAYLARMLADLEARPAPGLGPAGA
jgi:coproporphyrinogen III oxidase-like Fe-S oxidoreductase